MIGLTVILKKMCRNAWSERFNYFCIRKTKNKTDGKNRIFNESKTTYVESISETRLFNKRIVMSIKK